MLYKYSDDKTRKDFYTCSLICTIITSIDEQQNKIKCSGSPPWIITKSEKKTKGYEKRKTWMVGIPLECDSNYDPTRFGQKWFVFKFSKKWSSVYTKQFKFGFRIRCDATSDWTRWNESNINNHFIISVPLKSSFLLHVRARACVRVS